jgi:hypothetical protein
MIGFEEPGERRAFGGKEAPEDGTCLSLSPPRPLASPRFVLPPILYQTTSQHLTSLVGSTICACCARYGSRPFKLKPSFFGGAYEAEP